jgi:hypothetical protein
VSGGEIREIMDLVGTLSGKDTKFTNTESSMCATP